MLYKKDKDEIINKSNYEDKIVIKPMRTMKGQFPCVIVLTSIMSIILGCAYSKLGYVYGIVAFLIMLLLTIISIISASAEFHKLIFDKNAFLSLNTNI